MRTSLTLSVRIARPTATPGLPERPGGWVARAERWVQDAAGSAPASGDRVEAALAFALELGREHPYPAQGRTAELWELLATVAAADLAAARALEPHLDALAILAQAGAQAGALAGAQAGALAGAQAGALARSGSPGATESPVNATWGVFAAEGGPEPLVATPAEGDGGGARSGSAPGAVMLTGTKLWCSLADRLDCALVSALTEAGGSTRGLFAVDLRQPGVTVEPGAWHARGLVEVPSGPVRFDGVTAHPVGEPGWYLSRPGFAWGGIGVAACWFGGAVGVARSLFAKAHASSDPLLLMHLGVVDQRLEDARRALAEAAALLNEGQAVGSAGDLLASRVRATVAGACEDTLLHASHALGPAPLALDPIHAKRVADLELYIRQHHAEKDLAALGAQLAGQENSPW